MRRIVDLPQPDGPEQRGERSGSRRDVDVLDGEYLGPPETELLTQCRDRDAVGELIAAGR
jgi:hypothetical protein